MAEFKRYRVELDSSNSLYEGKRVPDPPGFNPQLAREEVSAPGRAAGRARLGGVGGCTVLGALACAPAQLSPHHCPPQGEGTATQRKQQLSLEKKQQVRQGGCVPEGRGGLVRGDSRTPADLLLRHYWECCAAPSAKASAWPSRDSSP